MVKVDEQSQQELTGGVPSRHLWVGNVAQDTPESVIRDNFDKFGELESVTVYPQRNYAFVNFRKQEHAEKAKESLQGFNIAGMAMRIEFAKGARPNRHLLVAGLTANSNKEFLEEEFSKFGAMDEFKFLRDKNVAYVDFVKTEDAIAAVAGLNNKRLGDELLRVDYRTHPSSKRAAPSTQPRNHHHNYHQHSKKDEPSEVLWIGLPTNSKVDEDWLRSLFVPYGAVERVKLFSSRHYAFVEFRDVREAAAAKSALHNKSINGHRLNIEFSTSEFGPSEESELSSKRTRLSPPEQQHRSASPLLPSVPTAPTAVDNGDSFKWNGIIAKAGTVVCQVFGFNAIGKASTIVMPHSLNCSARTDLDMLAKHVYSPPLAVFYFVPAREMDIVPYQDFMNYLRVKGKAGVAKLNDGAAMFLVPPSPFSEAVLKVPDKDFLFGVLWPLEAYVRPSGDMLLPGYSTPVGGAVRPWRPPPPPPPGVPSAALLQPSSNGPPFVDSNAQHFQHGPPPPPQLPLDQLAQLTALLAGQGQQQQPARDVSPLPPSQPLPPPPSQAPPAWPSQAPPAINPSEETFRNTLELAALLLSRQQQQQQQPQ